MPGHPRERDVGDIGPPSRVDRSWLGPVAVFADASGSTTCIMPPIPRATAKEPVRSRYLRTRATHRRLMARGLASDEAANLVAFLCGIPIGDRRWDLAEVNRLVFLRELSRRGRIGGPDDDTSGPH